MMNPNSKSIFVLQPMFLKLEQSYDQYIHSSRKLFFSLKNLLYERCIFEIMLFGVKEIEYFNIIMKRFYAHAQKQNDSNNLEISN